MNRIIDLIAHRPVYSIEKTASVQAAAEFMSEHNIGALAVMDGSRLAGIVSERDIIQKVIARGLNAAAAEVSSVMTTQLVVARVDESYESCMLKMKRANCRHLPVVDGDRLMGVLSLRDLLLHDLSEKNDRIQYLTDYMFRVPPDLERKYKR